MNVEVSSLIRRTNGHSDGPCSVRPQGGRGLLVHLLAAGGACDGYDSSQTVSCMLHKLLLQSALPAGVRPGEPLVKVQEAVQGKGEGDNTPAHRTPHLQQNTPESNMFY